MPLHKEIVQSILVTPPYRNGLFPSTPWKKPCNSNRRVFKDPEPSSSAVKGKKGRWDDKEAEADNVEEEEEEEEEREGPNDDSDVNKTPLLRSTKKRFLSIVGRRAPLERRIKRRRFSSPLSSDEKTETGDESDISTYAPSKPHHISTRRPTASHLTGLKEDPGNDSTMEMVSKRSNRGPASRMAVIYEQQCWEGEIIDERHVKQGPGRPRKQYLVRWKQSWVDGGRLTAPELLQNWKEMKASKCR